MKKTPEEHKSDLRTVLDGFVKISKLQMTSCSVGEESRNAAVEFDGQVVGVECRTVVPHAKEFTAQHHGKSSCNICHLKSVHFCYY